MEIQLTKIEQKNMGKRKNWEKQGKEQLIQVYPSVSRCAYPIEPRAIKVSRERHSRIHILQIYALYGWLPEGVLNISFLLNYTVLDLDS